MCINLLLAAFSAVVTAEKPVTVDFGPDGEGGYPAFEVKTLDGAAEAALHVVYATHPDGLGPKGDFWRETSARYLGPNVDLPILPANIDRYDDFTVKAGGAYRAPLCQGLVRYAKLSTATKGVKISVENFRLQNDGVHATEEPTGSFSCSDERLNGVWKASVRTCQLAAIPAREKPLAVKCAWTNVVLGPTYAYVSDGAKRDRLVWSGDLWWADLNYYYAFDPKVPYLKGAILMLAENQTPEGFVQACPHPERHGSLKAGEWGPFESDEFAAWLIPVVCNYRLYTGDEETVRRVLPSLKKLMAYLESHCREDGLFEQRMETSKNAGALRFGANSTDHRAYMDILLQACRRGMAELTGEKAYADRAAQVAPSVKKAYDIGDGMYRFSIEQRHRNYEATALNYALGDPDGRSYPLRWRKQIWHAKFEATSVRALFDGGFGDEALKAIEAHNWFKILDPNWKGLRTTYECMYMNTKNWGDEAHPDTAIAGILSRAILGVVPTKPGWAEFKFDPHPPKSVTWAKGTVPTPKGMILVEWKRDGDRIVEKLTIPDGLVRTDVKEKVSSDFDIRDYGAKETATPKENAAAIQQAIDAAAVKGGRVIVPKGTWVSGTIWLKTEVMLRLEKGAVLKASPNLADYNAEDAYPENFGCPKSEYWRGLHFIIAREQRFTGIEGEGTIDGNGDVFFDDEPKAYFDWMKPGAAAWWNGIRWAKDKTNLRPGQLVVFVKCTGVSVKGVTIRNSPCWSLFFHGCDRVEVKDYVVRNGTNDGNTDGVDLDCTSNATLENLDIDTGDDAIAIRAAGSRLGLAEQPPCQNITIRNAKLRSTSSVFRIGVGEGLVKNVTVENVTCDRGGTAINMNTLYGDREKGGVDMENIVFRNCRFDNCREAYAIRTDGKALKFGIRDVTFEGCTFPEKAPRHFGAAEGCPFKPERVRISTPELEKAASEDYAKPVRPGGVDGQAFWNNHSEWFMYPPSFDFKPVAGAAKYRFEFVLDGHQRFGWEADAPTACLAPTWDKLPENGMVTVFCHALDAQGAVKGLAGERTFWKTSRFRPGRMPEAARTPSEAAAKVYDYLFDFPSAKYFREHGKPDPAYRLNAYPAKMHSSTILAMVTYAKLRPDRRDAALKFARTAADYLISISQPADAPLAYMPPTYQGVHYTSKQYAGQQMMLYPAAAASAYLTLYEAVKDEKYLVAARHIADTYLKLQGEDGTCYLKMWEKDGKNISPNRVFPIGICEFLEKLYRITGEQQYREAADRGFAFVERGPLRDWNWEGQFEDVVPTEKYVNLTKHPACATALYILKRFPGDKRRIAQAREILRWSEDQFIAWTNPCRPDGTGFRSTGKREGHFNGGGWDSGYRNWMCPSVMEQYYCYVPIDASAAKLINTYVAIYRAEKNPLDLEKARALADSAIRIQEPNGRIRTFWTLEDSKSPDADWINCMAAIASALNNLGER